MGGKEGGMDEWEEGSGGRMEVREGEGDEDEGGREGVRTHFKTHVKTHSHTHV